MRAIETRDNERKALTEFAPDVINFALCSAPAETAEVGFAVCMVGEPAVSPGSLEQDANLFNAGCKYSPHP